jgi:hypothetical protein
MEHMKEEKTGREMVKEVRKEVEGEEGEKAERKKKKTDLEWSQSPRHRRRGRPTLAPQLAHAQRTQSP